MTAEYAAPDREVVDYRPYCLDPELRDRQTGRPLLLRGPDPGTLEDGGYFVCLGAAQTFGRFCQAPFPALLQSRLGIPAVNLGRGGAGPSFFSRDDPKLMHYLNRARFVVVQVMAGRSESNSLFRSNGLGHYTHRTTGEEIGCDEAFRRLLAEQPVEYVREIVEETRRNWVNSYRELLEAIRVPTVLFWFSERRSRYRERYRSVDALFGRFPQLVNREMVRQVAQYTDQYVSCIGAGGLPQPLLSRFSGAPTVVEDPWAGRWEKNWYYPSPQMHEKAARVLERACRQYLPAPAESTARGPFGLFGRLVFGRG